MKVTTTSDKIVLESGQKYISFLSGDKYGNAINLAGKADKQKTLSVEKYIQQLSGLKHLLDLDGEKYQDDLEGEKHISTIYGSTDRAPLLYGEASEGFWHIHVDTTYFFADDTIRTADRD